MNQQKNSAKATKYKMRQNANTNAIQHAKMSLFHLKINKHQTTHHQHNHHITSFIDAHYYSTMDRIAHEMHHNCNVGTWKRMLKGVAFKCYMRTSGRDWVNGREVESERRKKIECCKRFVRQKRSSSSLSDISSISWVYVRTRIWLLSLLDRLVVACFLFSLSLSARLYTKNFVLYFFFFFFL